MSAPARPTRESCCHVRVKLTLILGLLFCSAFSGCAALTNPTANGVPVRILPDELLAESKEGFVSLPLTTLRQPPPKVYLLEPGDTLGIYIEGILGSEETPPPVNIPDSTEEPPSIGYPFPIRQDGTISLPYVGSIKVAKPALEHSITIEEAEERVVEAYREKDILRVEDKRILVSLFRPRYVRVLVMRDDSSRPQVSIQSASPLGLGTSSASIGGGTQTTGQILELPAGQNDLLNALAKTGGFPDIESTLEIVIQRGYWDAAEDPTASYCQCPTEADLQDGNTGRSITRIPLRIRAGEPLPFRPQDVVLHSGDIVIVRNRQLEFFYTGGLIVSGEHVLPLDYDLTAVEAVLRTRGPLLNGGVNTSNLNGSVLGSGIGNPSPSLLSVVRKTPLGGQVTIQVDLNHAMRDPRENILVQAEDVLILQEMPNEAITRYFTQVMQFNFFTRIINRQDAQASGSIVVP
ncbi:Polysaccharide biosynthesis/export protein [Bythopirellula polymerisocia]|uniref:Polysaccharide biosynthesis/export protein n=2 Tax=Bythopirellula polymerisocia TaxID=2528003 RepID=A0A5C6CMF8_9BACT|nr:Polysaccharide biosynthesis/export protein [Bythopirellula polymerisocia]